MTTPMPPALQATELKQRLREFICTELTQQPSHPLADDEPMMRGGLMDSFSVAQIGVFIDLQLNVFAPDAELTVEGMDTLNQIAARVLQG